MNYFAATNACSLSLNLTIDQFHIRLLRAELMHLNVGMPKECQAQSSEKAGPECNRPQQ